MPPADVFNIAWVLAIRDHCSDERVLVLDTGRLCKVDHFARVVLLVAESSVKYGVYHEPSCGNKLCCEWLRVV